MYIEKIGKHLIFPLGSFGAKRPEGLPDTTAVLNVIEGLVYPPMKKLGFRKFGRTLHRFVSGDISQVINFQILRPSDGAAGIFCVNIGIRIPECADKQFTPSEPLKTHYSVAECCIRTRLGKTALGQDVWFSTADAPERTAEVILRQLQETVLPCFDALSSREAILAHRREYPDLDELGHRRAFPRFGKN